MHSPNRFAAALAAIVATGTLTVAQNAEMQHMDGTPTISSRSGNNAVPAGIYQRYPADQIAGAVALKSFSIVLQDQNAATAEDFTLVVRPNDPTGPLEGQPEVGWFPPLASGSFNGVLFGGVGGVTVMLVVTFPPGGEMPLPSAGPLGGFGVPEDDIYVGTELPATTGANPAWPADGLSVHANSTVGADLGEQFRANFVGYSGVAGVTALGWGTNLTAGTTAVSPGNRSWVVAIRPTQDVLQPFADNAALFVGANSGLNPNFGYVGIAPDVVRGDGLGFRLRSNAPIGSPVILAFDFASVAPWNIGFDGHLCLNIATVVLVEPLFTTVGPGTVPFPPPVHTSEVVVGPFFGIPGVAGAGDVFLQCATLDGAAIGGVRLSTMARINL